MKSIVRYINENINDKVTTLIDYLNIKLKENDEISINKLYSTFKKDEVKPLIKEWVLSKMKNDNHKKHQDDFMSAIYGICDEFNCWNEVYDLAQAQINNEKNSFFNINFEKTF